MEWTRTETLALAQQSCSTCFGLGLKPGRSGSSAPCNCVFRAIFRAVHNRFRHCASKDKHISRASLEANPGRSRKATWGLKNEEFMADFILVSRRTLNEYQYKLFNYHFLLGADWKLCCRKLNLDRGTFFHDVYRIQQLLGRTFRELEPYALFPLDEYFNSTPRSRVATASITPQKGKLLPFPLRPAA
jgi:hypothetical protein